MDPLVGGVLSGEILGVSVTSGEILGVRVTSGDMLGGVDGTLGDILVVDPSSSVAFDPLIPTFSS